MTSSDGATGVAGGSLIPVTCLVVDDLEENRYALQALLARPDVTVLTAGSARDALELLLRHDVALALLDVQMPDIDGFELAELMRGNERTRHIPLILVTAGTHDFYRTFKGYEAGAVDFLHKPLEPHILRNKAEVFFQLHRQKIELSRQLEERTAALQLQETFNAVLGHDLRNPLNAMMMSAQIIQRTSTEPAIQESARRILSSGRRMAGMIEDLLDLSRLRSRGGVPLQRAPTELGEVALRVVQEHRAASPGRMIELAARGGLDGRWDGARLAQVLSNLLGNALKHGDGGCVQVELDGTRDGEVEVRISNEGSIPAEMLPHLFDLHSLIARKRARGDGLGLGLYIVRQLVEAHGGTVTVGNAPDGQVLAQLVLPRI